MVTGYLLLVVTLVVAQAATVQAVKGLDKTREVSVRSANRRAFGRLGPLLGTLTLVALCWPARCVRGPRRVQPPFWAVNLVPGRASLLLQPFISLLLVYAYHNGRALEESAASPPDDPLPEQVQGPHALTHRLGASLGRRVEGSSTPEAGPTACPEP